MIKENKNPLYSNRPTLLAPYTAKLVLLEALQCLIHSYSIHLSSFSPQMNTKIYFSIIGVHAILQVFKLVFLSFFCCCAHNSFHTRQQNRTLSVRGVSLYQSVDKQAQEFILKVGYTCLVMQIKAAILLHHRISSLDPPPHLMTWSHANIHSIKSSTSRT